MNLIDLFTENYLDAFSEGAAVSLLNGRNKNLGILFTSERSPYYIQILYRMLCFRREHEIEPLNDEIYLAVKSAQENLTESEYTSDNFNYDMNQLVDWELINSRIEKERLRGYKDIRRQKFRYRLDDEVVSFLAWLEERLINDLEDSSDDARNLLMDVTGRLRETLRLLDRVTLDIKECGDDEIQTAKTVVYNADVLNNLTLSVSRKLTDLNAELIVFTLKNYDVEAASKTIKVIEYYLSTYLMQIHKLRQEITSHIDAVTGSNINVNKLNICTALVEKESENMPSSLFGSKKRTQPNLLLKHLSSFYEAGGQLDKLCERVNSSAMKVWGKINARLRELERSSTRLADLDARMKEMADFEKNETAPGFFAELMQPAYMKTDPNYWDAKEKADPPIPKRHKKHYTVVPDCYLSEKKAILEGFVSMEQSKLNALKSWIEKSFNNKLPADVSEGSFKSFDDYTSVMQLIKSGYLGNGVKLAAINYGIEPEFGKTEITVENMKLELSEFKLNKI